MFGIIISVIVLITMGYLILKNYKPQVVLADFRFISPAIGSQPSIPPGLATNVVLLAVS